MMLLIAVLATLSYSEVSASAKSCHPLEHTGHSVPKVSQILFISKSLGSSTYEKKVLHRSDMSKMARLPLDGIVYFVGRQRYDSGGEIKNK